MDNSNSDDLCGLEPNGEGRMDDPASTSSVHQMVGGGKGILYILSLD